MQRRACSNCRSFAKALPSSDKKRGTKIVAPVDLDMAIAELKDVTASEARPVRTNRQLLTNPPDAFQKTAPFSSASATSSSASALAISRRSAFTIELYVRAYIS